MLRFLCLVFITFYISKTLVFLVSLISSHLIKNLLHYWVVLIIYFLHIFSSTLCHKISHSSRLPNTYIKYITKSKHGSLYKLIKRSNTTKYRFVQKKILRDISSIDSTGLKEGFRGKLVRTKKFSIKKTINKIKF